MIQHGGCVGLIGILINKKMKPRRLLLLMAGHINPSGLSCKAGGLQRRRALKSYQVRSFITSSSNPFLWYKGRCIPAFL